jgi:uridylate kinase
MSLAMDSVVVSLGGSVLLAKDIDVSFIHDLSKLLSRLSKKYRLFMVIGGGHIARSYIARGRSLGFSEEQLDLLGIAVTRINAQFLSMMLPQANKIIPELTSDAAVMKKSVVVMGGTRPGHSTDMVGAELAEKVGAVRLIIATNVDGVFDKDPNKYPDAKQLSSVHIDELLAMYGAEWKIAGKNMVIDGPALHFIKQVKLRTLVVNGLRLNELEKAIENESFDGTTIEV